MKYSYGAKPRFPDFIPAAFSKYLRRIGVEVNQRKGYSMIRAICVAVFADLVDSDRHVIPFVATRNAAGSCPELPSERYIPQERSPAADGLTPA